LVLDGDILAYDVTRFAQSLLKIAIVKMGRRGSAPVTEVPDAVHLGGGPREPLRGRTGNAQRYRDDPYR